MGTIRTPIFPRAMEELYNGETCKTLHHSHLFGRCGLAGIRPLPVPEPAYGLCAVRGDLHCRLCGSKAIFPDKHYQMPGQEEPKQEKKEKQEAKKEPEPKKPEAPKSTGNPEIDNLLKERERALSEMRRLNDSIEDETISAQIDHLEEITSKIIDQVIKEPSKLPQIRRFLNYYLPTTLKILNAYDRMDAAGVSGDNIDSTKQRVERMMGTIVKAFDKQLDACSAPRPWTSPPISPSWKPAGPGGAGGRRQDNHQEPGQRRDPGAVNILRVGLILGGTCHE